MPPPTTEIYTLSLHDALPICWGAGGFKGRMILPAQQAPPPAKRAPALPKGAFQVQVQAQPAVQAAPVQIRSEEHTSELQSLTNLVCRLLLEKKKKIRRRQKYR